MNQLKDAKEVFDKIEIPEELNEIVTNMIKEHRAMNNNQNDKKKSKIYYVFKYSMVSAAGVMLCFMLALNTSEAFAKGVQNLPFIGGIAKVLTVRSYQTTEGNANISVDIPEIVVDDSQEQQNQNDELSQGDNNSQLDDKNQTDGNNQTDGTGIVNDTDKTEDTESFLTDINAEIDEVVNTYLEDAKSRQQADKDAFIATGGTEEEWEQKDLDINVDYEVKYQVGNLISLVLTVDENWYGAYDMKYFYNLNLEDNERLTLKDILGDDYITIANESILKQMKKRVAQDNNLVYWGVTDNDQSGIDGFTTVDENTSFYLNEEGKTVVCFGKYEIAPGFMGAQEFVIE